MSKTMPIIEARNKLTTLPEQFEQEPDIGAIAITRRGKPVLAIMPWELYEAIVETLEIMEDEELMAALRQSIKEADEGKILSWEAVKAEMGL